MSYDIMEEEHGLSIKYEAKSVKSVIQTIYDIVKAQAGEIKVETKEGGYSEFKVQLPLM
jgi:hypothetical protein